MPMSGSHSETQSKKVTIMLIRSSILAATVALLAAGGAPGANAQGVFTLSSTGFKDGEGTMKLPSYFGPCTPPGPPHHYIFTLMATDLEPAALKAGMSREELLKALDGHAKAATSLVGTFSKP